MAAISEAPRAKGQLVWCPGDPTLGVGVVTEVDASRVWVHFFRLQEPRAYTTRGDEQAIMRYAISHGERVRDQKGDEHRVRHRVDPSDGPLALYEIDDGRRIVESDLVPEIRDVGAKERLATLDLVHPEVVRARVQGLELAASARRPGHAAILGSRVEWLPHQIDVATRAIESDPVRMLLADEVGLGKTVEAALIYAGLRQEGRANRVLVLTPDALCIQWLGELYRKVHELFVLLDQQRIEDACQDFPDVTPFEAYRRIVASIDRVVREPDLAAFASEAEWDLVIVDEAHHLRWRPDGGANPAYALVEALAARSRHLLLLTATPMALDPVEYHALLRLLDPTRFDDPRSFETVRCRVAVIREVARSINIALEEGRPLGKSVEKAALDVLGDDAHDKRRVGDLIAINPDGPDGPDDPTRRKVADEVLDALRHRHGLADYVVRNRRGPVGGLPERRPMTFALEPTEPQYVLIDVGQEVMFELAGTIADARERSRTLGQLLRALWATPLALAEVLEPLSPELVRELRPHIAKVTDAPLDSSGLPTGDARLRWLVEEIAGLDEADKTLVFVESAVAVHALKRGLDPVLGGDIALFHRGLSPRDQDRQVAWFRDPSGPRIMLSTEAGGEGRNFQFCHRVVLYDLPWRPATIEQRIGRVDRVGQHRDVLVLVPHFKSGYEAAVLKVMQESIGVLDRTVGGIDPVLEYVSDQLADLILSKSGVDEWKKLFLETKKVVEQARERIEDAVDPILDHASFSPDRVRAVMAQVPDDLERRCELFVERYAEHSKLDVHSKGGPLIAVDGAPGAAGRADRESGYTATFSRTYANDHEDVEFLSFGHPLVEQALEWARDATDASAALALCRGCSSDGAVFLWQYGVELPDDVPEAAAYFDHQAYTFALDES
ncbi:MAG: SNF2-related protein, partial [Myxococcota bacterium]